MTDNVTTQTAALATVPDLTKIATDQLAGGEQVQFVKLMDGTLDSANKAAVSAAGRLSVDASGVAVPVTDNAGSLTVDAPVGTPVFARLSDGAAVLIGQKVAASSLPVVVASDQTVIPVSDNAGSLTVDAPVGTPAFARLSDGAAALIGQKAMASSLPVAIASDQSALPAVSELRAATLHVTGTAAANNGVTVTLPSVASQFHYITSIQIDKLYGVIGVAAAAGVILTSTNLPGNPAWTTEQLASAAGTVAHVLDYKPTTPLKSSVAATNTTIVCPAQLQTIWRVNVSYFTAA